MGSFDNASKLAYCNVFGVKANKMNAKHRTQMNAALDAVWTYDGMFPGETEELQEVRLDMESPAQGEYSELGTYLKKLPGNEDLVDLTAFEVVFTIYKRMIDGVYDGQAEVKESVKEAQQIETAEESVTDERKDVVEDTIPVEENDEAHTDMTESSECNEPSSDNNISFQEEKIMEAKTGIDALEEMERQINANGLGKDIESNDSKPEADAATVEAAKKLIVQDSIARRAVTRNAKITKFIMTKQPSADRVVRANENEEVFGYIQDPDKVLKKFINNFGVETVDGQVIFNRCVPGSETDAKEMYDLLVKACNGENTPIKVAVSESLGALRALEITSEDGAPAVAYNMQDVTNYLLTKAAGVINADGVNIQAQLGKVTKSISKAGSQGKAKQTVQSSALAVRIAGRKNLQLKEAENLVAFVQMIDTNNVIEDGGFKSQISAKYKSTKTNEKGQAKAITFKIPLRVKQYALVDQDKYVAFKPTQAIGKGPSFVDVTADDAITKQFDEIAVMVAAVMVDGGQGEFFDKVRAAASEVKAAEDQAVVDAAGV